MHIERGEFINFTKRESGKKNFIFPYVFSCWDKSYLLPVDCFFL